MEIIDQHREACYTIIILVVGIILTLCVGELFGHFSESEKPFVIGFIILFLVICIIFNIILEKIFYSRGLENAITKLEIFGTIINSNIINKDKRIIHNDELKSYLKQSKKLWVFNPLNPGTELFGFNTTIDASIEGGCQRRYIVDSCKEPKFKLFWEKKIKDVLEKKKINRDPKDLFRIVGWDTEKRPLIPISVVISFNDEHEIKVWFQEHTHKTEDTSFYIGDISLTSSFEGWFKLFWKQSTGEDLE